MSTKASLKRRRSEKNRGPKRPIDKINFTLGDDIDAGDNPLHVIFASSGVDVNLNLATVCYTATYPCTLTNIRWDVVLAQTDTINHARPLQDDGDRGSGDVYSIVFMLLVCEQGTINRGTITNNDFGSNGFSFADNVIAFMTFSPSFTRNAIADIISVDSMTDKTQDGRNVRQGTSKAQRKLKVGDVIAWLPLWWAGGNTDTGVPGVDMTLHGNVTFFLKG